MLLRRTVKASNSASLDTARSTVALEVKAREILLCRSNMRSQKKSPMAADVAADTMVANFALPALPAPSSLLTLTLHQKLIATVRFHLHMSEKLPGGSITPYSLDDDQLVFSHT